MSIPTGDQGPQNEDIVAPTGYERSPAGAALAAMSATVRLSVADDEQWPQVGQKLLAPSDARDRWAVTRSQVSIEEPVKSSQAPALIGYQVSAWGPDRTAVRIYSRMSDRSIAENAATVAWQAGDWRLVLPREGQSQVRAVAAVPNEAKELKEVP